MVSRVIFSVVLFLLFLSFFISGIINLSIENAPVTGENITYYQVDSGVSISAPPVCTYSSNIIFAIGNAITCAGSYVLWLGSLATIQSDIQWLGILFVGIAAVLLFVILKIISGFIPSVGGVS